MTEIQLEKIQRLKEVRKQLGLNQFEMAEKLGLKQPNLSSLENGKSGKDILIYIPYILQVELGIDKNWFNNGSGEMFLKPQGSTLVPEDYERIKNENEYLKKSLDDKEVIIRTKDDMIALLREQIPTKSSKHVPTDNPRAVPR